MYNKVLSGILVVLIIAIIGVLGYFGYGYYKKITLNADAKEYLEEFDTLVVELSKEQEKDFDAENQSNENNSNNSNGTNNTTMRGIATDKLVYKGFTVVGKIEMPTIRIQYPILDVITHANAIEVSVGILYGPGVNKPGNTVIIGHNYNNGLFFGKNKNLKIGEKIYLTDIYGNKVEYTIFDKYYTPESDTSYITRKTDGKTEVTLVTCDTTGKNRLVVCARAE
ncbi:MAG: sortase [Clostridia bacterium]|nr:sortase [Clostridia bacterium]